MRRRGFLASLAALAVSPLMPAPVAGVSPLQSVAPSGVWLSEEARLNTLDERYLRPAVRALVEQRDAYLEQLYRSAEGAI